MAVLDYNYNSNQQHLASTHHSISYTAPIRFLYPIMNTLHSVNTLEYPVTPPVQDNQHPLLTH